MADPDLQISGGGGGWGGGKGGYLDPNIREGTGLQTFLFSVPLGPQFGLKISAGEGGGEGAGLLFLFLLRFH